MAVFHNLDDLNDPRLRDYVSLTDVALRKKLEAEHGLYMAESTKVITRALRAGHTPRSVLTSPRWLEDLRPLFATYLGSEDGGDVPVFVAPEDVLEKVVGFHLHRGALAAMNRPALMDVDSLLAGLAPQGRGRRVLVLESLVDHTNVGAVFRSAAALGIDAILVTPECADPLYRRSIRVSMGTVFQVPWTRIQEWPRSLRALHERGWISAALALREDAMPLQDFAAQYAHTSQDILLVLGTEGDGLSQRTISTTTHRVVIPMAGGVDSLNVAAAGAVAAYALVN